MVFIFGDGNGEDGWNVVVESMTGRGRWWEDSPCWWVSWRVVVRDCVDMRVAGCETAESELLNRLGVVGGEMGDCDEK